jgi:fructoselysine-6-P-deglycase FrlB-like protein
MTSRVDGEISSQPKCWERAMSSIGDHSPALPSAGSRVAVIGCGTSLHIASAYAAAREHAGAGVTDAFPASEAFLDRGYDAVLALSRSGTTTEILQALADVPPPTRRIVVTADAESPAASLADHVVTLDYADEQAVVQTRFATTALVLLATSVGLDLRESLSQARDVLAGRPDIDLVDRPHYAFLGRGWSVGIAAEAALKVREAGAAWSESYPALEYRHGPLSAATERSVVWFIGPPAAGLADDVAVSGATVVADQLEPLAELVRAQRVAVETARARGLDPDNPRYLTRSVVLS